MDILNLNDVPPPKTPAESEGSAEPAAPASASSFDTSALTAPPPSEAAAATTGQPVEGDPLKTLELTPKIVEQLSTVYDPEIPVNIYELGLIYDVAVDADGLAVISMTLTAPGCPAAVTLPAEVQGKVKSIEGVSDARVDLVWEPPWTKDRMTEAAKLQLGIFD
jgi:FeS assembly SUF system protein